MTHCHCDIVPRFLGHVLTPPHNIPAGDIALGVLRGFLWEESSMIGFIHPSTPSPNDLHLGRVGVGLVGEFLIPIFLPRAPVLWGWCITG
jgi:hypothetical protein